MSTAAENAESVGPGPRLAFILHWFPKPSETFIYDELSALRRRLVPLDLFTLYGPWSGHLSPDMPAEDYPVRRLGVRATGLLVRDILFWLRKNGTAARRLWRTVPWRKWSDPEMAGENLWAFLCGFRI
ncbi:MAG: hypothetical protein KJ726_07735, partial [Verrucomicrobia bacterium]|nr:hypothetical protein [Verrucomicrobiota bacterium]